MIPVSRGGRSTWGNTVTACARCNQRKADRMPHEAGMKLWIEPKTPRTNYLLAAGDIPATWKLGSNSKPKSWTRSVVTLKRLLTET